jgi:hypothetical protein
MWKRSFGLGLLVGLMGTLGGGCKKSTPAPLVLHPAPVETVAAVHWLGKQRLAADTNASFLMGIWNLAESKKLEAQTLDRLAMGLLATNATPLFSNEVAVSGSKAPNTNPLPPLTGAPALLRPVLDDLLQQESFLEVRQATNLPGDLTFAIRLSEPRARLWETNLAGLLEGLTGARVAATPGRTNDWQLRFSVQSPQSTVHSPQPAGNVPEVLELARAGEWTVIGLGHQTNVLTAELLDSIRRGGLSSDPLLEEVWLHADVDLRRLASALLLGLSLPADLPRMTVDVRGDGQNVRTRGQFNFPQALPGQLASWNIPTNLLHDPLCSFTAMRGFGHWLSSFRGWTDLQLGATPDELYFWAQSGLPFLTFCAAPLPNASNEVYQITDRLLEKVNPALAANGIGRFARATNFNGATWEHLPVTDPFVRSVSTPGGDFAYSGFTPDVLTNRPAPPDLLAQVFSTTNMVAYDWEITGPRVSQWLFMGQFLRMASHHAQVPPKSAGVTWLMALEDRLGNSVTALTKTGPAQLSVSRRSAIGFTAIELHLLADWLESPQFPRGLYTILAPPEPLPAQKRAARTAGRANTNSVPAAAPK